MRRKAERLHAVPVVKPIGGTIDYSEMPPLLFLGEWVDYDELQLKNVRKFEGWA